ncbi:MAG TPA: DUF4159 domain-containing protein [Verrucomicrobiales bacterium]|nr:DUF4159 domain-containing protein [Verrucomicrobiales bacterium]
MKKSFLISGVIALLAAVGFAQYYDRGFRRGRGDPYEIPRTAREVESNSTGTPTWTNPAAHVKDVFTFVRIVYSSGYGYGGGYGRRRGGGWRTDLPDSDLNLSWRLQQMTSMKVDPDGRNIRLTDPELKDFPFIYIVEPGSLYLSEEEATALRNYLLNGGFLMLDDFWGDSEWENCEENLKKVFPNRSFKELEMDHPIYHCVFEIKQKWQVPNIDVGANSEFNGVTWEYNHDGDTQTVHHKVITDDKERVMVIACHNTDNGDGWEREGESDYYFHNFSEKVAYPLGINILFYAMTH